MANFVRLGLNRLSVAIIGIDAHSQQKYGSKADSQFCYQCDTHSLVLGVKFIYS